MSCALGRETSSSSKGKTGTPAFVQPVYPYFQYSPLPIMVADGHGWLKDANPAALRALGYDLRTLRQMRVPDLAIAVDRDRAAATFHDVIEKGEAQGEFRLQCRDGSIIVADVRAVKLPDGSIAAFLQDITERKRAQQESEDNHTWLRLALQAARIGTFHTVEGTNTAIRNPEHGRIFGYARCPEEWNVEIFLSHVHPDDQNWVRQELRKGEYTGKVSLECRIVWPDGSVHWIDVKNETQVDETGKVAKRVGTVMEITEWKLAQQKLQESENRLGVALTAAKLGMFDYDVISGTAMTDLRHDRIFGFTSVQSGWSPAKLVEHVLEEDRNAVADAIAHGEKEGSMSAEFRTAWPDGSIHWVAAHAKTVYDDGGRVVRNVGTLQDITERKRAEQAVAENEARFRALVTATSDVLYRLSADGSLLYWLKGSRHVGDAREPNRGWIEKHVADADQAKVRAALDEAIRTKTPLDVEHRFKRADGSSGWALSRAVPMLDHEGEIVEWFGASDDITADKQAEDTRIKMEASMASLSDAIFISDLEGNFVEFNDAFVTFHRFANRQECAKTLAEYRGFLETYQMDGTLVPLEMWAVPRALRGESATNVEYRLRRKDTGETWFGSYSFAPIRNKSGAIFGSVVVGRDITEQKLADEEVRESGRRLELALAAAAMGTFDYEVCTGLTTVNLRHSQIYGYDSQQMDWSLKRMLQHVLAEDREALLASIAKVETEGTVAAEYRIRRRDGAVRWISEMGRAVCDADGQTVGIVGTIRDVTEEKQSEAKLQETAVRLETALEASLMGTLEIDVVANKATCDARCAELLGFPRKALECDREEVYTHMSPDSRAEVARHIEQAARTGFGAPKFRVTWPDGSEHWVQGWLRTRKNEAGQVIKRIGTVQDITERELSQQVVKDSAARLEVALDAGALGLFEVDVAQDTLTGNLRLGEIFGFEAAPAGCRRVEYFERVHPDDMGIVARAAEERIARGVSDAEYRVVWPDGSVHWVQALTRAVHDEAGNVRKCIGTVQDISGRKLVEQALLDGKTRLDTALEAGKLGVFETDVKAGRITGNARFWQIAGFAEAPADGKREWIQQRIHPDDRETMARGTELCDRAGESETESRLVWPDGSMHWVSIRGRSVKDASGTVVRRVGAVQDITERRLAEQKLQDGSTRLTLALESAGMGIFEEDLLAGTEVRNLRHGQIFGYELLPTEWNTEIFLEHIHRDDLELARNTLADCDADGAASMECRIVWPDQSIHWISLTARSNHDLSGKVIKRIRTCIDITERKEAENAIRESEEQYRSILAATAEGVVAEDASGKIIAINHRGEILLGRTKARTIGMTSEDPSWGAIHEDGTPYLPEEHPPNRTLRTGQSVTDEVMGILWPDGNRRWLSVSTEPMMGKRDGFIEGVVSTFLDITERRAVEKELARYRQFLEMFIAYAPAAIAMFDRDMRYIRSSRKWRSDLGLPPDHELAGKLHYECFPVISEQWKEDHRRGLAGETVCGEDSWELSGGRKVTHLWEVHPWGEVPAKGKDSPVDSGGIMVMFVDVTERRKMERQLQQALKMEAVGQLAGGVAHDFNNMLQVIHGYGELLHDHVAEDDLAKRWVEDVLEAANRASSLTRQLLAFSRQQVLKPVVMDLNSAVERTIKLLKRTLPESIELEVKLAESLWRTEADPDQIGHVLINLVLNARDAMPRGGTLSISTSNESISADTPRLPYYVKYGEYAVMTVEDTGIGIEASALQRIFEPFYTTKEKDKGTGLGLAGVYGIIKQSMGYVWAESEAGKGACFKVCLPRTTKCESVAALLPPPVRVPRLGKVLVVDDDAKVREIVTQFARSLGFSVVASSPGESESAALQSIGDIDLLITDVVMPGKSGPELAQQFEASNPRLKTIYMSGHVDESAFLGDVVRRHGAFLQKPFSVSALEEKLREVMGQ